MSIPFYPTPTPPMKTRGTDLPQWAKTYRILLMVFHTMGLISIAIVLIAYIIPLGSGMDGKAQMAWTLLFLWLAFIFTSIPYIIANIVYGILWLTSLRGKGYRVNRASSFYVAIPPLLIATLVISWLILAYTA